MKEKNIAEKAMKKFVQRLMNSPISSKEAKFQKLLTIIIKNILAFLIRKSYTELTNNRMSNMDSFLIPTAKEDENINDYVDLRRNIRRRIHANFQLLFHNI